MNKAFLQRLRVAFRGMVHSAGLRESANLNRYWMLHPDWTMGPSGQPDKSLVCLRVITRLLENHMEQN